MVDVLLYSGGLDSYIAYFYLRDTFDYNPKLLYVPLGHRYQQQEIDAIHRTTEYMDDKHVLFDSTLALGRWEEDNAHIPLRNSFLAHTAALYGADRIWLITQEGETDLPDRSFSGYLRMSELLTVLSMREVKVDTPFWTMSKVDMVKWYKEQGLPIPGLLKTHSCYAAGRGKKPCGNCGACFRRFIAFYLNDIKEEYELHPLETNLAKDYLRRARLGQYAGKRGKEILDAFRKAGKL